MKFFPYPAVQPVQQSVKILAHDHDTLNTPIQFYLQETIPSGFNNYFAVTTGIEMNGIYSATVQQTQTLNRLSTTSLQIIIRAEEQSDRRRYERALITVTVNAANIFPPTVRSSTNSFTGYIPENSPRGTLVLDQQGTRFLKLIVTDGDVLASDPSQTYSYTVTDTAIFSVTQEGYIALATENLDYEVTQRVVFQLITSESSTAERRSTTTTLTVEVIDRNDFSPTFPATTYVMTVPEADYSRSPVTVVTVQATDADSGDNGIVTYEISAVSNNGEGKFAVDANSGSLQVVGQVLRDELYTITIQATDKAEPGQRRASQTAVLVNVTRVGNLGPAIPASTYSITVSEGVTIGASVFATPATDPDNDVLSYQIISGNNNQDFVIGRNTGLVSTRNRLDRESRPSYSLLLHVADTSHRTATTTLSIKISDINDQNPSFINPPYIFSVLENELGALVGQVMATDADEPNTANSQIAYRNFLDSSSFIVNSESGQITTIEPLDWETKRVYLLLVVARDAAFDSRSSTATVTINVVDRPDSIPVFVETNYEASVPENENNGLVTTVTATDADSIPDITYQLLGPASTDFTISESGEIRVKNVLNYEVTSFYEFYVTTADGRNSQEPSSTATVRVTVLNPPAKGRIVILQQLPFGRGRFLNLARLLGWDLNDFAPVLTLASNSITMQEIAQVGEHIITATAVDNDPQNTPNSRIAFSIADITPASGSSLFYINPNDGRLYLGQPFRSDISNSNSYQVTIRATDFGSPTQSGTTILTVNVLRNSHKPVFTAGSYETSIVQTLSVGASVLSVKATDLDTETPYNVVTYSVLDDSSSSQLFGLPNSNDGLIVLKNTLTRDSALTYVVRNNYSYCLMFLFEYQDVCNNQ
ncbi:cadherin-99C-like [Gigantopelta aegis]|uniref:cadherin-99C-like n=1 Tax=Gigantopelta aegis TaxID=1735272 RepID=UPI001B8899E0|nr:cadherin-99C-like [Gigantopelta aegis]